jgi:hypothetical protein
MGRLVAHALQLARNAQFDRQTVPMLIRSLSSLVVLTTMLSVTPAVAAGQESASREAAAHLTQLLDQQKLEAIATRDPEDADRFIAALYFPGAQLFVLRGLYEAPALLEQRIAERQFRDVYVDLGAASPLDGRCFVMDMQADGLRQSRNRDAPFDIVYRHGTEEVAYDGDWKRQELTQSAYRERFALDEAEYSRMLAALVASLTQTASPGATRSKGGM